MKLSSALAVLVLSSSSLVTACGDGDSPPGPAGEVIELPDARFYPEGVAFDRSGAMYVASLLTGQVAKISSGSKVPEVWLGPGAPAGSVVGMLASRDDELLWLCLGTFGTDAAPAVIGFDVRSAREVVRHPFPPQRDGRRGGLCNELAEDEAGNVYASDSFGARIMRVAAADRLLAEPMAVWVEAREFGAPSFGLNGLAYASGKGGAAVFTVNTGTGALLRVPVNADGSAGEPAPVVLPRALQAPDGLRIHRGRAIVVEQLTGQLTAIDLATGELSTLASGLREPTSLDLWDEHAWVSEGQLSHLFDGSAPALPFTVVRVPL